MKTCQYLEVKHFSWRDVKPFSLNTKRLSLRRKKHHDSADIDIAQTAAAIEPTTSAHVADPTSNVSKPKKSRKTGAIRRNTRRVMKQFSPHDFTKFEWEGTTSFTAYVAVVLLLSLFLAAELNPFYLKFLLWMEPDHPFVIMRLVGVFLCGLPAVRELYTYMNDPRYAPFQRYDPQT
jgi:hypothetical protein